MEHVKSWVCPGAAAFAVSMLILSLAFNSALHPGAAANINVNPLTCRMPEPSENGCWDARMKYRYPKCVKGLGQKVRGVPIPRGTSTCYKTIYYNIDDTLFSIALWAFGFMALLTKMIERIIYLQFWVSQIRTCMLVAFIANIYGFYFSFMSIFHYLNDHEGSFWFSQLYFSMHEYAVMIISTIHLDKRVFIPWLLSWMQGSASFQLVQLLLDEFNAIEGKWVRNALLGIGDLAVLIMAHRLLSRSNLSSKRGLAFFIVHLLVFQIMFWDLAASTSIFRLLYYSRTPAKSLSSDILHKYQLRNHSLNR